MNLGGTIHLTKTGLCVLLGSIIILFIYLLPNKRSTWELTSEKINLNQLLDVAIQAAEKGGEQVAYLKDDLKISYKGKTKEGANDSVTTADFKSHCVMSNYFKNAFPTLNIVSEENVLCDSDLKYQTASTQSVGNDWVSKDDVTVWFDPLDATQEYTEKLTDYVTTMVCVALKGKPVIGVIHKPFTKTTFWAWVGKSHSINLISKISSTSKLKFIVSRSHNGRVEETIQTIFKERTGEIIKAGGAGYKVLEVISGNADIYLHVTAIKKWDICAGNAIVKEFNGTMTTLHNTEIDYGDTKHFVNEEGLFVTLQSIKLNN